MEQDSSAIFSIDSLATGEFCDSLPALDFATKSVIDLAADTGVVLKPEFVSAEAVYGKRSVMVATTGTTAKAEPRSTNVFFYEGFLALGLIVIFLLSAKYLRSFFFSLWAGLLSFRAMQKQFEEDSLTTATNKRVLLAFSIISIGFLGWLLWLDNNTTTTLAPGYIFLLITGGVAFFFLLKMLLIRAIGSVAECVPAMKMIIYAGNLSIIACGLLVFPLSLLIATANHEHFLNVLLIISFGLIGTIFLLYLLRVIQIFFNATLSIFFLILYLCTFEIVPILLLYRFIS